MQQTYGFWNWEVIEHDLNEDMCVNTLYSQAFWHAYGLTERIEAFLDDLNNAGMSETQGRLILVNYLHIINKMVEKSISAELVHRYLANIKRATFTHQTIEWADEIAHILVWHLFDELFPLNGVDAYAAVKAVQDEMDEKFHTHVEYKYIKDYLDINLE